VGIEYEVVAVHLTVKFEFVVVTIPVGVSVDFNCAFLVCFSIAVRDGVACGSDLEATCESVDFEFVSVAAK